MVITREDFIASLEAKHAQDIAACTEVALHNIDHFHHLAVFIGKAEQRDVNNMPQIDFDILMSMAALGFSKVALNIAKNHPKSQSGEPGIPGVPA